MDFWRPRYSKDAYVDGHYSVSCYLEALEGAFRAWQAQAGGGDTEQFAALAYHVPYPKMAKKAHEALRRLFGDAQPEVSFARQVKPGLALPERIGNIYTGSLYLSPLSVLAVDGRNLDGERVGLFSYGSGSCAEFFTGRVVPGAQARVKTLQLDALLSGRERVSVAEYERLMGLREAIDQKPLTPAADGETARFLGVEQHKRVYSRPSA